jgi:hypothetical protein
MQELGHIRDFPFGLTPIRLESHALASQCTFDKNDFACAAILIGEVTDATRFHIE